MLLRLLCVTLTVATFCGAKTTKTTETQHLNTCTYSFTVPRDDNTKTCPQSTDVDARVTKLEHVIGHLQSQLELHAELLRSSVIRANQEPGERHLNGSTGVTYVRWGRSSCPASAEYLYDGYAANAHYSHGGGVDFQCLPRDPEFPDGATAGAQTGAYIYGVEYESGAGWPEGVQNTDAPCAVCNAHDRTAHLMIPAKQTCPLGWTREYSGWLVSQAGNQGGSTFACLDGEFEIFADSEANLDGGLWYVVEARCGSLPCPPYEEGMELSCVVCTK